MVRSLLVATLVAGGVAVPVGAAQAHPVGGEGGPSDAPAGMSQMHELMQQGNPGMAQMCELMHEGTPGHA
jgi:hypothetical protein